MPLNGLQAGLTAAHLLVLLVAPPLAVSGMGRIKAWWTGRKGPRLLQTAWDWARLWRKRPVYSRTTTWIFPVASAAALAATLLAALMAPIFPGFAPLGFHGDFVAFAYLSGLARLCTVLAALDTGSAFEGMGASREVTLGTVVEPAFFVVAGTYAWVSGADSFQELLAPGDFTGAPVAAALAAVALLLLAITEAARVPVDDPATHLELTMIHEVMILDHSGPELAMMSYAAGVKLVTWLGLAAVLLNPLGLGGGAVAAGSGGIMLVAGALSLVIMALLVGVLATVESAVARLRMSLVPYVAVVALVLALAAFGLVLASRAPGGLS